jgi:hypothetical protein
MLDKSGVKKLGVSAGGVIDPVTNTITDAKVCIALLLGI